MDLRQFLRSQPDKKRAAVISLKGPLAKFFECSPRVLRADPDNNFDQDLRKFEISPCKRLKSNDSWAGVRTCDATPVATTNKRKCKSKKCKKCGETQPSFGNPGDKPKDAKWCLTCKPETAVNVKSKKCECGKARPIFGNPGDKPKDAKWCKKCKPETAVYVVRKKCECGKSYPNFGNPGDKPKDAKWCKKCKPETAVDVVRKKCKCGKSVPSYGNPGDKPKDAKWCKKCKPETAVYVVNTKKCECGKAQPSFGNPGDKPKDAKWCADCKPKTAVNVKSKKCECGKARPIFGNPGDKPKDAKWCKKCKPETAVDVVNKKCKCGKSVPSYGNPGDKPKDAKWCAKCKPETAVDVKNTKKCECGKAQPSFGNPGDKPKDAKWCKKCKPETAVDVINKKCECGKSNAIYGNLGDKHKDAKWCANCETKPETAVNVVGKICISDHCDTTIKYDGINNTGYCMGCFSQKFPESKLVRFVRCKELAVVRAIYQRFAKHDFAQIMVNDRRIQGGCSQKRPDICIDLATHVLIVEVDEFQHLQGDYSCENKRMMELFEDGQRRPIVFLRFNPDKYTNAFGCTVPSPWTKTEGGEPRIDPKRKHDWRKRLIKLFARIKYWTQLSDFPTKEVSVEHLFYDA